MLIIKYLSKHNAHNTAVFVKIGLQKRLFTPFDPRLVAPSVNGGRQTAACARGRTWKRMETTAPQISSPTMNCSPNMARMMFSQNRLARPLRRRMIHFPPLRLDSSWRREEQPGCDRQVRGATGVRQTGGRGGVCFLPPTWVWSPPWRGGSHCVRSGHLDGPDDCRTSRTAPPERTHSAWWQTSVGGNMSSFHTEAHCFLWMQPGLRIIQNVFILCIFHMLVPECYFFLMPDVLKPIWTTTVHSNYDTIPNFLLTDKCCRRVSYFSYRNISSFKINMPLPRQVVFKMKLG